jgi:hypothetical protein
VNWKIGRTIFLYADFKIGLMNSISRKLCARFVKGCMYCTCKKPQQNIAPLKPIVSKYFMHRGQLDLVDKRADPDVSTSG